jgi:hypothetical protein
MKAYVVREHSGTKVWWWFFTEPLVFSVYYFPTEEEAKDELAMYRFRDDQVKAIRTYITGLTAKGSRP